MAGPTQSVPVAPAAVGPGLPAAGGAGVAAADDDDVLAARVDRARAGVPGEHGLGVRREVLHREMHPREAAALYRQVARLRGPGADDGRRELLQEDLGLHVAADVRVADELDPLLLHQPYAPQDDLLLVELHVRDPVHEHPARELAALEN